MLCSNCSIPASAIRLIAVHLERLEAREPTVDPQGVLPLQTLNSSPLVGARQTTGSRCPSWQMTRSCLAARRSHGAFRPSAVAATRDPLVLDGALDELMNNDDVDGFLGFAMPEVHLETAGNERC